jgi:hypothetical protein
VANFPDKEQIFNRAQAMEKERKREREREREIKGEGRGRRGANRVQSWVWGLGIIKSLGAQELLLNSK